MPLHIWSPLPVAHPQLLDASPLHLPLRWARLGSPIVVPGTVVMTPGGWSVSLTPDGKVHESGDGVCTWSLAVPQCPAQEGAL